MYHIYINIVEHFYIANLYRKYLTGDYKNRFCIDFVQKHPIKTLYRKIVNYILCIHIDKKNYMFSHGFCLESSNNVDKCYMYSL
jgi:hypothetical protein